MRINVLWLLLLFCYCIITTIDDLILLWSFWLLHGVRSLENHSNIQLKEHRPSLISQVWLNYRFWTIFAPIGYHFLVLQIYTTVQDKNKIIPTYSVQKMSKDSDRPMFDASASDRRRAFKFFIANFRDYCVLGDYVDSTKEIDSND